MAAPVLFSMFETVLGANEKKLAYETMIASLLARKSLDKETAADFLELQEAIGANTDGRAMPLAESQPPLTISTT